MSDDEDDKKGKGDTEKPIEAKALRKLKRNRPSSKQILKCSFCGKEKKDVKKLIQSESGAISCIECIQMCNEIIDSDDD